MKSKLPLPTEHQIQTVCINYLKYKGYYVQRLNAGKYSIGEGRFKRFIQGVDKGTPDIMAFRKCSTLTTPYCNNLHLYFIEVKRPGNNPTIHQEMKMEELEAHGAKCLIVHSMEELEQLLSQPNNYNLC